MSAIIILSGCTKSPENITTTIKDAGIANENYDYVRAVWFTYYELSNMIKGKTKTQCESNIYGAFKRVKDMGFNTVTVQVRPFADAFYISDYFPSSSYIAENQGAKLQYDPLTIMCYVAKALDLKIEAWINPYRVSNSNDIKALSDNNIAKKWRNSNKTKSNVYVSKKGIYFNPASDDVTKLIVSGVKEIIEKYEVDAIHFDDYFYPDTNKRIDSKEYNAYKRKGGKLSLDYFRRERVSYMIKSVYKEVKSSGKGVRFGISPTANISNDYSQLYADVEKWAGEEGYCDYICPQIYFGFRNVYQPFMFTVKKWVGITNCDLYIGLPLYKAGKSDKYAAREDKSIINEFKNNDNIIARQIIYLSKLEEVKGFYVFSYSCLTDKRCEKEVENMLKAMSQ